MNLKWHYKHKIFNVKTAEPSLLGLRKNKNFTKKKVLTHLSVVKIVGQKLVQTSTIMEEEAVEDKADNVSLFQ